MDDYKAEIERLLDEAEKIPVVTSEQAKIRNAYRKVLDMMQSYTHELEFEVKYDPHYD